MTKFRECRLLWSCSMYARPGRVKPSGKGNALYNSIVSHRQRLDMILHGHDGQYEPFLCCCHHGHTKGKIGRRGPTNPSLGKTPTIRLYSVDFTDYILWSISYQKKDWRALPANPSFGMTLTKILSNIFPWHVATLTQFFSHAVRSNLAIHNRT